MLTMAQGGFVGLGLTRGVGQGEWTLAHGLLILSRHASFDKRWHFRLFSGW